jgi:cytochrome c peroxidase
MIANRHLPLALTLVAVLGCPEAEDDGPWTARERALLLSLSPVPAPPAARNNPVADDPRAAELGHRLFFDERLSTTGEHACATCHDPARHFTDGRRVAEGKGRVHRNTPTLLGAAHQAFWGWDGRSDSLWSQALLPLEDPREMGLARTAVVRRVAAHHGDAYTALFGPLPDTSDTDRFPPDAAPGAGHDDAAWRAMSPEDRAAVDRAFANVGRALEAYQRRLVPPESPFDRHVAALRRGDDTGGGHLSDDARRGLRWFLGEGQCVQCHHGPLLTDREFHNLGLPPTAVPDPEPEGRTAGLRALLDRPFRCGGRRHAADDCAHLRYLDPEFEDFLGAFKTPSLRNVAHTAPYMHAGHFGTLEEVIAFYRTLPGRPSRGHRALLLDQIPRTLPVAPLVAFLRSLGAPLEGKWVAPPHPANGTTMDAPPLRR